MDIELVFMDAGPVDGGEKSFMPRLSGKEAETGRTDGPCRSSHGIIGEKRSMNEQLNLFYNKMLLAGINSLRPFSVSSIIFMKCALRLTVLSCLFHALIRFQDTHFMISSLSKFEFKPGKHYFLYQGLKRGRFYGEKSTRRR
ncbi:MAG: hypothetical protein JW768_12300 [Chitinispirillaceae bacterium]|nr:hypothetical protein [Chitinispirillaceae bacterium]